MSFEEILSIIAIVLYFISTLIITILRVKNNLVGTVSEFIAKAEEMDLTGPEKMTSVVEALYAKIPVGLKKFFTKEQIQQVSQAIFDSMRKYAKSYIDTKLKELESNDDTTTVE